ncbi:MAG: nucleotide exchange factor GrpE [Alphaproteobacteria bacterium]|nr:nucleotide exchange factor GrpE [Alphaproteobacteria bacterium]
MADEPTKPSMNQNDNSPRSAGGSDPSRPGHSSARRSTIIDPDQLFDDPEQEDLADDVPFDAAEMMAARLEEMEKQQANLADRLAKAQEDIHRYQAEIQNLHRRREKETEETSRYAIAKFANDIVTMADNFERAMTSVPAEAIHDNPVLKSLLDGVTMTEREFLNVLERHGVKRISPKDELFDPHRHQAVMEQEDKAVPSGTVLQVFQAGYVIADRVLRPAMVVVARGGPKPVKPMAPAESEADAAATTSEEAASPAQDRAQGPEANEEPPVGDNGTA